MQTLPTEPVAVMFSGGRDSTLAAAYYAEQARPVHLLTFDHGYQFTDAIVRARVRELRRRWPNSPLVWVPLSSGKAFRDIALMNLVADIQRHQCNLVCLGSALAMVARSIDYCRSKGIRELATGYSRYQSNFPEQSETAIQFFDSFARGYDVELRCPGKERASEADSKILLDSLGLSTKALEPNSLWDWTYSENVDPAVTQRYLEDKAPIAHEFIARLQQFRNTNDRIDAPTRRAVGGS